MHFFAFFKVYFFWSKCTLRPIFLAHVKIKNNISYLGFEISILHRQMSEQMPFEVYVKMVKIEIRIFLKCTFLVQMHFDTQYFLAHVIIKNKISYLGFEISILNRQMTEQMPFEVDVKMVKNWKKGIFKVHFFGPNALCNSIFLSHVKIKNKISYLGKEIFILPKIR